MSSLPPTEPELYNMLIQDVQGYAIFLLDTTGCVASWNAGAESMKGYTESEIVGRHYSLFYTPDEVAAGVPEAHLAVAVRDGRAEYEGWRLKKDGSQFWASIVTTAITDDNGRLRGFGKVTRDLTERRAIEQETLRRSLHDDLTGLPNRTLLGDRLKQALSRLERSDTCLAVMFIDLDRFKRINDARGHDFGDSVLQEVAKRLIAAVRPEDTVGRVSGDEFLAVCEGLTGASEAVAIAERVGAAFASPMSFTEGDISVSVSIGVATTADPDTPARVIVRRSDRAMYAAKALGGATSQVHLAGDDEDDDRLTDAI
ncbi:MAG TPA: sensor domain-containing diguanylate cyclase [Acidimicrobiales bacterium]|nr:sensor domain-containing diguanylate cyclase [Acidimicrobiales bacterium]